jgi:uncharacterized membrane protein YbhN (UPF0104 family)
MSGSKNKHFYKVISLFIKWLILILSCWYIYEKIKTADTSFILLKNASTHAIIYLSIVFILMFANWGIEALKWKRLIAPLEQITFKRSLQSIFVGVTTSIFTPNRIGEFAGRVFYLQTIHKLKASLMSLVGSMLQLFVTIIAGLIACIVLMDNGFFLLEIFSSANANYIVGLLVIMMVLVLFIFIIFKKTIFHLFKVYRDVFRQYTIKTLFIVLSLSILRYVVFSIQFYLILKMVGVQGTMIIMFALIALSFFVISAIPTFALTEVAVRGAASVCFFNYIQAPPAIIVGASLLLWIINLAIPALLGSIFVWQLKFFKE